MSTVHEIFARATTSGTQRTSKPEYSIFGWIYGKIYCFVNLIKIEISKFDLFLFQIYGSSHCTLHKLKGVNGKMNVTVHPSQGKDLLPRDDKHSECKSKSGLCFIAGKPSVHFFHSESV